MNINSEPTRRQLIEERDAYKIRAQHMDELVGAANTLEARLMDNDELKLSAPSYVALRNLRDILAKIKGETP